MRTRSFLIASAFLLSATLAHAQAPSKPKDDDLDALLNKVEQKEKQGEKPKAPASADAKPKAKADKPASPSDKPKTAGEVTGKDKELDDLLGKLGETKDEPKAEKKPPMGGAGGEDDKPMPGGGGEDNKPMPGSTKNQAKKKDDLTGQAKQLDEHLEELTGRKRDRQKGGEAGKKQENQGPLGDLVKEMREVEERLGKPDTGEQTRQKQTEIVKKMDTMIEMMKSAKNQQQAMRMLRRGQQPGQQQGDNPDNQNQGPPPSKAAKPDTKSALALDKNAWGHLPPDLRAEMENVFKEDLLPGRADLIKRYYLSVSKKSVARGE